MKPVWRSVLAAAASLAGAWFVAPAQTAGAPSAVEMTSEPHHRLELENAYVRVFDVRVPAGQQTMQHWHHHDDFWIGLGSSNLENDIFGQLSQVVDSADGGLHFSRGGYAHVVRNQGATNFHNVTIELLQPQGDARNRCGGVIEDRLPQDQTACQASEIFATTRTRVQLFVVANRKPGRLAGRQPMLVVAVDPCSVGLMPMPAGGVRWLDGKIPDDIENDARTPARIMVFTFLSAAP